MISALPRVVSREEWERESALLRAKEKAHLRAGDALAAERRRLPMVRISKPYLFDGPSGKTTLADLFDGRPQLALYHFMLGPGACGWPDAGCSGCSMWADNLGHPAHLHARGVSLAMVSIAPLETIAKYRSRMGWKMPWVSSANTDFNRDFDMTGDDGETFGFSIFLRDGDEIYRTYFTNRRGVEEISSHWSILDRSPLGRQELWEITPTGRPQSEPYQWWRRHDEYSS